MKIIFFGLKLNLLSAGGSNFCIDLRTKALKERGHNVSLVTFFSKNNQFKSRPSYKLIEKDLSPYNFILTPIKIARILQKFSKNSDIFFFEGADSIWGAGLYRRFGGKVPIVISANGYSFLAREIYGNPLFYKDNPCLFKKIKHKFRLFLEKTLGLWLANSIDLFLTSTKTVISVYQKAGFNREKFLIIPNFIDILALQNKKTGKRALDTPGDHFQILYVGALSIIKGVDILIKAFSALKNKEKCRLCVVGDGPEKSCLKNLVEQLGISELVSFYPWTERENLLDFYAHSDLFVHPARFPEPYGLTVLEAMAFGLPVIVSSDTGSADVLGTAGLIFKKGDVGDLKEKISVLINSPELQKRLSQRAQSRAKEFDYRNHITQLENTLINLMSKNKL